ncbi:MAG TPA: patatin-like phospholipase family protein [Ignavibacteria bacterium]|nr:patatin-like phospholipase family protein [Ignavibacteria bacterium]
MQGKINRAIVFSGGGDKGAFSVGVAKRLLEEGNEFDFYSGTSTGAMIAPLLAIGEIDMLQNVYTNIKKSDVLKTDHPYVRLAAMGSMYDVTPLRNLLNNTFSESVYRRIMNSGKHIFLSTVSMNNMQIAYFTNSDIIKGNSRYDVLKWRNRSEMIEAIMASAVQPVLMPTEKINGLTYADGGLRDFVPVDAAIDSKAEDIVCIVTTTGKRYFDGNSFTDAVDNLLKTIEIFSNDISDNDLRIARIYNDGIKYIQECKERIRRNSGLPPEVIDNLFTSSLDPFYDKRVLNLKIIRPKNELGPGLDFDTEKMRYMFNEGYNMNTDIINLV